jgi:Homeodomain-like domain
VQARIGVDKRQILTLRVGESLCGATQTRHPIQLSSQASSGEEAECTLSGRAQPSGARGTHRAAKRRKAFGSQAQASAVADAGGSDEAIGAGGSTVYRTKRRFVLGNLQAALSEEPRPGAEPKLSGKEEALLVATACSRPPEGRARWTLELLAGKLVKLTEHNSI